MSLSQIDLLVVGASGQDGTLLGQIADARGITWAGTSRSAVAGLEQLDPCDLDAVSRLCDRLRPSRIILLAAQSSVGRSFREPAETWRANTQPVLAVCEWIRTRAPDVRLVLAASGECFGPRTASDPARETEAFAPVTPYGASKAAAAGIVRSYRDSFALPLSIAYPFNHESPIRPDTFVFGKVLSGLRRLRSGGGEKIALGDLEVVRDWGWAPDYAEAMLRMSELEQPTELILATGRSVSLRAAIASLVCAAGLDWHEAIAAPDARLSHHAASDEQHADPSRAKKTIGWTGSTPFPDLAAKLLSDPH